MIDETDHLSGPTSYALTQIHPKTSGSVDGAQKVPASVHFHYAYGFDTQTLAQMVDSLVRVSRRAAYDHYASILGEPRTSPGARRIVQGTITLPRELHFPSLYPAAPDDAGLQTASRPVRRPAEHRRQVWLQALPF